MAKVKGICKNFDNCTLADKGEVQEVESTEFRCAECEKELYPVNGSTTTIGDPTSTGGPKLPVIIVVVVVLLGLIGGGYFLLSSNKAKKKAEAERAERAAFVADSLRKAAEEQRIADSINLAKELEAEAARLAEEEAAMQAEAQRIADSIRISDSIRIADSLAAVKNKKPAQTGGSSNWNGVASYNGPMQGGQPNGIGGKLTFKSNYQLDLKDGRGTRLDIRAGETIENTKFENGKLRQGELHRKDGTRKWFNI